MPAVFAGHYSRMQPPSPPNTYPLDAACASLQLLFIKIWSLIVLHRQRSKTDGLIKKLGQELQHRPEGELIAVRQQYEQDRREAQTLCEAYATRMEQSSLSIGMRICVTHSLVVHWQGDMQAVMPNSSDSKDHYSCYQGIIIC